MARRTSQAELALTLPPQARFAVPIVGTAGGAGTSTVAAMLATALHSMLPAPKALAVIDAAPAALSPWPGALETIPVYGVGELTWTPRIDLLAKACGQVRLTGGSALVLADTNPQPSRGAAYVEPDPNLFHPFFSANVQALVLDCGAGDGARMAAHAAGGAPSLAHRWLNFAPVVSALVWVTTAAPAHLAATISAVTAAERTGGRPRRWVVAVVETLPGGLPRRARADLTLLADRVGAICLIEHRPHLAREPAALKAALTEPSREDTAALVAGLCAVAGLRTASRPRPGQAASGRAPLLRKAVT